MQHHSPHHESLDELIAAHASLFVDEPSLSIVERPFSGRRDGLSMSTLRIRETDTNFGLHLRTSFGRLFDLYGASRFSVSVTANAILRSGSGSRVPTWSVWFGQHFNRPGENRHYNFASRERGGGAVTVSNLGDIRKLDTRFSASTFEQLFLANHSSSDVTVESLISVVYLIGRDLPNYERDRATAGRTIVNLF
jgi:hypothetical protein